MFVYWKNVSKFGLVAAGALVLAACGGGGGMGDAGSSAPAQGSISGVATKGPMNQATVTAYGVNGGQAGAPIGMTSTDANGNFSMTVGSYMGPVMLQVSGGSYTDEATGIVMPMATGDVLTAIMPSVKAGAINSGVQVTPITAMAQAWAQHMTGGMTDANIAAANAAMGANFSVNDILHTPPMNPLLPGSGAGATQDAQNYGMTLAAMTQYAQTLGMGSSSAIVSAMMSDASDGVLDGKAGTVPIQMGGMTAGATLPQSAGTTGVGLAMGAFMGSAQNRSGVVTTALMHRLTGPEVQTPNPPLATGGATLSGTAFNGTVTAGTMMAFALNNGAVGAQLASVALDAQGNFTLPLGSYSGAVLLQMTRGSYLDETTKTSMTMGAGDFISAVVPAISSGAKVTGVWVTPLTAMAQTRALSMNGGMTDANIAVANTAVGNYFAAGDILHTRPINPTLAGAGSAATTDARNYGMVLAAISQYAKGLNMASSSSLVSAMMSDVADGVLDGKRGANQISLSTGGMMGAGNGVASADARGLVSAMTTFMTSALNASGVTLADMTALMQKLINSGGRI